jgi:hypothetical protein
MDSPFTSPYRRRVSCTQPIAGERIAIDSSRSEAHMPTTAPETRLQQWIIESLKLIASNYASTRSPA